ncbi:hypothetical protein EJ06DRAFT_320661 [Trichodelitschia bisporula]|uniref:Uncharacterized protein n=1 Tax=Trichodelitschia bisporula TaxID=703511 RepID=A0A6G1I4B0_9PEZI|nr:hypothetical protein EJ06DRAFT_320661 [Trichodelitschia bisporula]
MVEVKHPWHRRVLPSPCHGALGTGRGQARRATASVRAGRAHYIPDRVRRDTPSLDFTCSSQSAMQINSIQAPRDAVAWELGNINTRPKRVHLSASRRWGGGRFR